MIGDMSAWEVMCRYHGNGFILLVECAKSIDSDLLSLGRWGVAQWRMGTVTSLRLRPGSPQRSDSVQWLLR